MTQDQTTIDFAAPGDIRPLYALVRLRRDAPGFSDWQRAAARILARPDAGMLVARDLGGRLVGYCLFHQLRAPSRRMVLVATDLFAADPINPAPVRAALQAHLATLARRCDGLVAAVAAG